VSNVEGGEPAQPCTRSEPASAAAADRSSSATVESRILAARSSLMELVTSEGSESDGIYDALVFLGPDAPQDVVRGIVRRWKRESKWHAENAERFGMRDPIFWLSADCREEYDAIERYRFRECFKIGEFEQAFNAARDAVAIALLDGPGATETSNTPLSGNPYLSLIAQNLWMVSRSHELPKLLRSSVNVALTAVAGWQSPDGCWRRYNSGSNWYLPSCWLTALCSLSMLKLTASGRLRERGVRGAHWLLDHQNPDGSWDRDIKTHQPDERPGSCASESNLETTLLATEALTRSGIDRIQHAIGMAFAWICEQQTGSGMWESRGLSSQFTTVLACELYDLLVSRHAIPSASAPYVDMARDFLRRSMEFAAEDSRGSRQLAIIAAHQGIETLLYGFLSDPSVNRGIFDHNQTIGMRKALSQFTEFLRSKSSPLEHSQAEYANSLKRLAYVRDQVVHKAIDASVSECDHLVRDAVAFARHYGELIYGLDIWM